MTVLGTIISGSTLVKLIVGALAAGLGVAIAFSALIYCVDRATASRRSDQRAAAYAFQAASALALTVVIAIVAYGLILTTSKPK
jgi:F0F1-type ATP synthase assembly protein I